MLEMFGGNDHDNSLYRLGGMKLPGECQCKRRFAGAWRSNREEVARRVTQKQVEGLALPGSQRRPRGRRCHFRRSPL